LVVTGEHAWLGMKPVLHTFASETCRRGALQTVSGSLIHRKA
jgi:hypothetical protein